MKKQIWTNFELQKRGGRGADLKTDEQDLAGSGRIWNDLALILGIIHARQLPLALGLPNPLITSRLVD